MASSSGAALPVAQAGSEPPTTGLTVEQDKVVPLTVTLAEAGEVRRYDILALPAPPAPPLEGPNAPLMLM